MMLGRLRHPWVGYIGDDVVMVHAHGHVQPVCGREAAPRGVRILSGACERRVSRSCPAALTPRRPTSRSPPVWCSLGGCRPLWQVWQHHQADLPPCLRHRDAQLVPCCDWGVNVHYLRRFDAMQMWLLARSLYPGRPHNTEWTWYHVGTHHGPLLRISLAVQLPVKETKNAVRKIKKPIFLIVHSERITVRDRATRK